MVSKILDVLSRPLDNNRRGGSLDSLAVRDRWGCARQALNELNTRPRTIGGHGAKSPYLSKHHAGRQLSKQPQTKSRCKIDVPAVRDCRYLQRLP